MFGLFQPIVTRSTTVPIACKNFRSAYLVGFIVEVTFRGPEAKMAAKSNVPFAPSLKAHLDIVFPSVAHFNASKTPTPITANRARIRLSLSFDGSAIIAN